MQELFQIAGKVAGLGGIALVVFLTISKGIISKTREVNQGQSYTLLNRLLILATIITLIGMLSWLVSLFIDTGKEVRLKELDAQGRKELVDEIRMARDDLKVALESERKRTSELIELNQRLTGLLERFTVQYSVESLPDGQYDVIIGANETSRLALAEIERRIGGRRSAIARLQLLQPTSNVSDDNTLILASFSLRLYGSTSSRDTHEAVLSTIRGLEADILAVQEVANDAALNRLTEALPEYRAVVGSYNPFRPVTLFRKDRVTLRNSHELPLNNYAAPRKPLVAEFEVQGNRWYFVNVHQKSNVGGVTENSQRRLAAFKLLSEWIEGQPDDSIIVAGVFQVGTDAPEMRPLLNIGGIFASNELPSGATTYITQRGEWRGLYSHFVLFGPIRGMYIPKSVRIHDFEELLPELDIRTITETISDHSPMSIALKIK